MQSESDGGAHAMQTIGSDLRQMQADSLTANTRLIAHHDLDGFGDGMQVIKVGQFLYIAHLGTTWMALSILDVADPENPKLLRQLRHVPNTHNHKVQIVGNTLIQNSEASTYIPDSGPEPPVTGVNVYNLDDPTDPRPVGFHPVPGLGVHRIWFRDAPYAHIAAHIPGVKERGYQILDLSDQAHPRMMGAWSVPEDWEKLDPQHDHFQVHGVIPHGNRAYASCTDAGMVILDISDLGNPRIISHINWSPPYGGYSHTSLPLPGRGLIVEVCEEVNGGAKGNGDKRIWLIDVREERNPVIISSFPEPKPPKGSPWETFDDRPLRFGPHNVHENYADSFQSETLIFSTYFNAGMRVTDISNADRPEEVGYFVPPTPPGEPAPQINDLFVDTDKLVYMTDRRSGGLYIVQYEG
jgi:hypothetical protein